MSINLSKGQSINLEKSTGAGLTQVRLGLGWDTKVTHKKTLFGGTKSIQRDIDLDASALLVSAQGVQEIVYFSQLRSRDGSVVHSGDNRSGEGAGDDESIVVNLVSVPASIQHVVFTVNSYSGEAFTEVENAYVRVVDTTARDAELARFTLSGSGPHTALVMARVSRTAAGWAFTAIGTPGNGRVAQELVPLALGAL